MSTCGAGGTKDGCATLFLGQLLNRKTVGVIGAGRIGATYARMMVEGFKMNFIYYDPYPNERLENYIRDYGAFLEGQGEEPVTVTKSKLGSRGIARGRRGQPASASGSDHPPPE